MRRDGITDVLLEYLDSWVPYLDAFAAARVRVHAHAHGYDVSARLRQPWCARAYRRYASEAASVICVSDFLVARLAELGIPRERLHVIPCGVDVPSTPPVRVGGNPSYWLSVGRLVPKKGHEQAIRAFAVLPDHIRRETSLRIVGDGPLRETLESLVVRLGLSGVVHFLGSVSNAQVKELFVGAIGLVHHAVTDPVTGDEEGQPVAVLEAMSAGLPVVTTRHAGIPEAVCHNVNGLLVNEGDIDGTARAIERLTQDRELNTSMGVASWKRAAERYSWERERADLRRLLGPG